LTACPQSCGNCQPTSATGHPFLDELSFAAGSGTQGVCDTYVQWHPSISWVHKTDPLDERLAVQAETTSSLFRPDTITKITMRGLEELRNSPYLLARKFTDDLQVSDACDNTGAEVFDFVFKGHAMQSKAPGQMFTGVWLDSNNDEVSIIDNPRLGNDRVIVIQNGHQRQWSGYGTYCGERSDVTFANGVAARVSVADGGRKLLWSNGISWSRDLGWTGEGIWSTEGGKGDVCLLRAYGNGELIKLTNLVHPNLSGTGTLKLGGHLWIKFNEGNDEMAMVSGGKLVWNKGDVWLRHGVVPPCSCVPDDISWGAPSQDRPAKCIWIEITAHPSSHSDCETIQVWPGAVGLAFMCDSERWVHEGSSPTINVMRILRENVNRKDETFLKIGKDFEYAWDVLQCMARSNAGRLVDHLILDSNLGVYGSGVYGSTKVEQRQTLFRLRQAGVAVSQ